jgi:YggT family protein
MIVVLASTRTSIAGYLSALIQVYSLLIFLYIVVQLLLNFGLRPSYSRVTDAILTFLRDVCEPYLRIFRRVLPMLGPFDISPIVGLIVLQIINAVVVQNLIHG